MLVGFPATEEVAEAGASRGDQPLVVLSPGRGQLDRAAVSRDERVLLQLPERDVDLVGVDS